ncbi:MAG: sigma-54 dependent transcriptional regulator [Halothiobacillaceae bacterium]
MPNAHILIVDDEPDIRESVRDILEDEGYSVAVAEGAAQAQAALQARRADLILLDVWMPEMDGIGLLKYWHAHGGLPAPVVMMSGHGTLETAVEAIRFGAYDFLEKPLSLDKLLLTVENALQAQRLAQENARLKREVRALFEPVGDSAYMQMLKAQARRLAEADGWMLILGEPGVGKQTFARYIHGLGPRRHQPFIEVNLATLNARQGVAVELFGSEDGSDRIRYGLLEQAHGGTLFLAEVADLDKGVQTQLLSILESQSLVRVGGSEPVHVDVRVIAATARDLAAEVRAGRFREDLYHHLQVLQLRIAPLRDHAEDIPQLLEYELRRAQEQEGLPARRFDPEARVLLTSYAWPGNVRELRNVVQRLLILASGEVITSAEVRQVLGAQGARMSERVATIVRERGGRLTVEVELAQPLRDARDAFERAYLEAQLRQCGGRMTELARRTGMERTNLYRKLKALGIKDSTPRDDDDERGW